MLLVLVGCAAIGCSGSGRGNPSAHVCIDPAFSDEQTQAIIDAADEWHVATSGYVDMTFSVGSGCDDLNFVPVNRLREKDGDPALAITDETNIRINVSDVFADGSTTDDYSIKLIATHELGHYLTGSEHSSNLEDVMAARTWPVWTETREHLTTRDVDRLFIPRGTGEKPF